MYIIYIIYSIHSIHSTYRSFANVNSEVNIRDTSGLRKGVEHNFREKKRTGSVRQRKTTTKRKYLI